ncbi:uncharacterized protein METZ01_LOCUS358354 [marine metagenome]|uniref:Uncharacterized protein n=1 Tax=marine metagenome TaxID=408172 RepID=A0A382S6I3_9ZZZZ
MSRIKVNPTNGQWKLELRADGTFFPFFNTEDWDFEVEFDGDDSEFYLVAKPRDDADDYFVTIAQTEPEVWEQPEPTTDVDTLVKWWETPSEYPVIPIDEMCSTLGVTTDELMNSFRDYLRYNLQHPDRDLVVFSTFLPETTEESTDE